jgi:hypothetical protein
MLPTEVEHKSFHIQ